MSNPLHIQLRPKALDEVIGQDETVDNLNRLFAANRVPHTFLFTGPSGTGKTTLARVIAGMLECDITEVDAARYSGIDNIRELISSAHYTSLGESPLKMIIIDECHALSKAAWQTLLLFAEQPPEHIYLALCTTEPEKVPATIRTRCHAYNLKQVKWNLLAEYLNLVRDDQKLKVKPEFVDLAARKADGSVRQGLVFLSMLDGITTKEAALKILDQPQESEEGPIVLARLLVSGKATWAEARKLIEGMSETSPESIRLTILNYTSAVLAKEVDEKKAMRLLAILQAFHSFHCNPSERMAPVLLAVGELLLG